MTTYTKRTNAKRAAINAGIPEDEVEITVHKDKEKGEVRFGFKAKVIPQILSRAVERESRNGVRRPLPGGLCDAVWRWIDDHVDATVNEARVAAAKRGWNENNAVCEFYAYRKFHRAPALAAQISPERYFLGQVAGDPPCAKS